MEPFLIRSWIDRSPWLDAMPPIKMRDGRKHGGSELARKQARERQRERERERERERGGVNRERKRERNNDRDRFHVAVRRHGSTNTFRLPGDGETRH